MTYTEHELDGMTAQAERDNAAFEAACRERCPVACDLQDELNLAMAPGWGPGGIMGERWGELAKAERRCQDAKEAGIDLHGATVREIWKLLGKKNKGPALAREPQEAKNVSTATEAMVAHEGNGAQGLAPRDSGGVMGLALLTERDFEAKLQAMKTGQARMRRIQEELMVKGEDFGNIPGTPKPTLLKPGAEKLCAVYGLKATFRKSEQIGDGLTAPHLRLAMTCFLHQGSEDGPVVAQGEGAANSWETKHRYRAGKRTCPACGSEATIRKSKFPDKNTGDVGWWCKDENCKANFVSDDPAIVDQVVGTVDNPDPFDVENTLVKMALKRSFIDATLRATATSGLFTQDLEDGTGDDPAPPKRQAGAPRAQDPDGDGDSREPDPEAAYARHGVESPAQPQRPAPRAPRNGGPQSGGDRAKCPTCGKDWGPSKFPKPGATHYCGACRSVFDPSGASR